MGSPWKMFTKDQGQELMRGTNHIWTSINGVNGRKFTSKKDSTKYIFLPAGGDWSNTTFRHANTDGLYWCTGLFISSRAHCVNVNSNQVIFLSNMTTLGFTIRPVR